MNTARESYNNASKKSARFELVRLFNLHMNNGKGGYFPKAQLKIGKNELLKLEKHDKPFYDCVVRAIRSMDNLVKSIDRNKDRVNEKEEDMKEEDSV